MNITQKRELKRRIHNLQNKQNRWRKQWLDADVIINNLRNKIKGDD
jgi:hypothetical protein